MKVYVLHYQCYDESEVHGVYTEDAMKKELAKYAEWGREHNKKLIAEQKKRIEQLKARRHKLGQRDREIQEQQKQIKADNEKADSVLRRERKNIMREMTQLALTIMNQEGGLEKMENLTDDQLAQQEMNRGHMYFEEFNVLGCED